MKLIDKIILWWVVVSANGYIHAYWWAIMVSAALGLSLTIILSFLHIVVGNTTMSMASFITAISWITIGMAAVAIICFPVSQSFQWVPNNYNRTAKNLRKIFFKVNPLALLVLPIPIRIRLTIRGLLMIGWTKLKMWWTN